MMDSEMGGLRKETLLRLLVPVAVGGAAGFVLTQKPKPLRQAMQQVSDVDVGQLAADLRDKVGSVLGKETGRGDAADASPASPGDFNADAIAARREQRLARRERRRQSAKA
jgi:hypothetical protein